MIETLTLALATPIAKAILDKFYEGVGSKLGEKAVELFPEKVTKLGQLLWDKVLRRKVEADTLLNKAAQGSITDQSMLAEYVHEALDGDEALRNESQTLAADIYQVIQNNIDAKNVQQIFGGQGLQVNEKQDQPIIPIQGNPTLTLDLPKELEQYLAKSAEQKGLSIEVLTLQLLTYSIHRQQEQNNSLQNDPLFLDDAVYQDDGPADLAANHDAYLYGEVS